MTLELLNRAEPQPHVVRPDQSPQVGRRTAVRVGIGLLGLTDVRRARRARGGRFAWLPDAGGPLARIRRADGAASEPESASYGEAQRFEAGLGARQQQPLNELLSTWRHELMVHLQPLLGPQEGQPVWGTSSCRLPVRLWRRMRCRLRSSGGGLSVCARLWPKVRCWIRRSAWQGEYTSTECPETSRGGRSATTPPLYPLIESATSQILGPTCWFGRGTSLLCAVEDVSILSASTPGGVLPLGVSHRVA